MVNTCHLGYTPSHLHWNDKPIIENFYPDEKVFRRVSLSHTSSFSDISLIDISVNRSGENENLSNENDALWDTRGNGNEKYQDCAVETLEIKKLDFHVKSQKIFYDEIDNTKFVIVRLLHDPISCNYAHCVFEFMYENQIVTRANYNQLFNNKKDKIAKRLRNICRDELNKMVVTKKIEF